MKRRDFIQKSAALLALSAGRRYQAEAADLPPKRVGLIGCGWYGKSDIFRLVQVSPVEIVSLCDVDKKMLADCAEMAASRQASKKKPRIFTDYREMLKEKDLDLVEIATPDHWHALPMIEAVKAGADLYLQKPISVDVAEGQAMLAAARKYKRVVQVGMQRRSTPHLIEARGLVQEGRLGTIGHVGALFLRGRTADRRAAGAGARYTRLGILGRPRAHDALQPRRAAQLADSSWNTATAPSAICESTCSTWCAGSWDWAGRSASSPPAVYRVLKGGKNDIANTQTAIFEYDNLSIVWQHRRFGPSVDADSRLGRRCTATREP